MLYTCLISFIPSMMTKRFLSISQFMSSSMRPIFLSCFIYFFIKVFFWGSIILWSCVFSFEKWGDWWQLWISLWFKILYPSLGIFRCHYKNFLLVEILVSSKGLGSVGIFTCVNSGYILSLVYGRKWSSLMELNLDKVFILGELGREVWGI